MKIGINASFARKSNTGIGQVTVNYLKALSNKFQKNETILYLEEELEINIPNFRKKFFLPVWKRDDLIRKIWWEKYTLPGKVKKDNCEEFISLYQCPTILPKNIKHTMVVHDIVPEIFPEYLNNIRKKIYWNLTKKAIKKADNIIAVSKHTKKDLVKYLGVSERKIEVKNIDVDGLYKREISENESMHVLRKYELSAGYIYNVGGLDKRKNIQNLVEAYEIILKEDPNVPSLVISGKLMPELSPLVTDVEKIVREKNLERKVKLLDFTPQEDMPALYKNASVFAYPSTYEGFGMPPLEAMNMGVPVVAAKESSLPEVLGDAVVYIDPDDPRDIAEKIKQVLGNPEKRDGLIKRGRKQAQKFSWESFI
jgi:glycosyltransferase involved in cell wall biosynthesis